MKQHKQRIQLKILITLKFISLHEKLLELSSRKKRQDLKLREFDIWECYPSKHFNVGSMLFLGWYDVATSHNVKSTLKFTTLNNVETTLCFSTLNWTTLDNVETTLSFSTSIFTTLGNVETTLQIRPFGKNLSLDSKTK